MSCTRPTNAAIVELAAPITRWDEAVPLGNGFLGTLLWGDATKIHLSLDRADLWDVRTPDGFTRPEWNWTHLQKLVAEKNAEEILRIYEEPYHLAYPTKLPGGRIEWTPTGAPTLERFELDTTRAVGRAVFSQGTLETFCQADEQISWLRLKGVKGEFAIVPPAYGRTSAEAHGELYQLDVAALGYDAPKLGTMKNVRYAHIVGVCGFQYTIAMLECPTAEGVDLIYTIAATTDGSDSVALAVERLTAAAKIGYDRQLASHVAWWANFWSQSSVSVPSEAIQKHYRLVTYFLGSSSHRNAPPIPLQGVWTADEGTLPPWKGDYHNDLNTQLTYWSYLNSNHLNQGLSYIEFNFKLLPKFRAFAKSFYGVEGAVVPGVMAIDGQAMGGWVQYSYSPTNGAWVGQAFHRHWQYTMDATFLRERAIPFCSAIGEALVQLLKPNASGLLELPLSSSPEIHDNRLSAFMTPNTTYDLSLMRWLFGALDEMCMAAGDATSAARWRAVLAKLPELAVNEHGALKISPDEMLGESHRHHSHLMAIYPLGTLTMDDESQKRTILETLKLNDILGTGWWCGYSFSWMACLAARCGQANRAVAMLDVFVRAFVLPNGFHINGDNRNMGFSVFKYRPFTLEGNFAAAQAVHEMLLQGAGGIVRIFPAVPDEWAEVSFDRLRCEGAFRVSATRKAGRTISVTIRADVAGTLRLNDPFAGQPARWSCATPALTAGIYTVAMQPGETITATVA